MVVLKRHTDQNNSVVQLKRASESQSKWTYYTHFTSNFQENNSQKYEVILLPDIVFQLILWTAMLCIFSLHTWASESERFLKIFLHNLSSNFSGICEAFFSSQIASHRLKHALNLHSILESTSKVNQAWNKHEAWVCQGEIKLSSSW